MTTAVDKSFLAVFEQKQRPIAFALLVLTLACLGFSGWALWTATPESASPKEQKREGDEKSAFEEALGQDKVEKVVDYRNDRIISGLGVGLIGFIIGSAALALLVRLPQKSPVEERAFSRVWILSVGGLVGLMTVLIGACLGYIWRGDLITWVEKQTTDKAWWPLSALTIVYLGLVLIFVSLLPARAEERRNPTLRRILYGYNAVLNCLLVLMILVIANVFGYLKIPNKLDTTEGSLNTLNDTSKAVLKSLQQQLRLTVIARDGGRALEASIVRDLRQVLTNFQESSNRVKVEYLTPGIQDKEIAERSREYPQIPATNPLGVLVSYGDVEEDAKKTSRFIPFTELYSLEGNSLAFQGEARLVTEISFLLEGGNKPIVYITQGNNELLIEPPAQSNVPIPADERAYELKRVLERRNIEVRSLLLDGVQTRDIPSDATAVIVLGPRSKLLPAALDALDRYAFQKGKLGKVIFLLGPLSNPRDPGSLMKTGLEDQLAAVGVSLGNEYLATIHLERTSDGKAEASYIPGVLVEIADEAKRAGNEIAKTLELRFSTDWLPVRSLSLSNPPDSGFQTTPLVTTSRIDPIFLQPWPIGSVPSETIVFNLLDPKDQRLAQQLRFGRQARPVGALVTGENNKPRFVVFGASQFLCDGEFERNRRAQFNYDLIAYSLDWLRERPQNIGIQPIAYKQFSLKLDNDRSRRLVWLPLLIVVLGIGGLGAGVWVVRRR